jgi:hypothetical protein
MPIAAHVPIEKTKVYSAVTKTCRATVERGLFQKQYTWVKVNDLDVMWPHSHVREAAMTAAKKFVEDMRKQGFNLLSAEADIQIYGPLRHHDFTKSATPSWSPSPGMPGTFRTVGYGFGEEDPNDAEDFLLRAQFLSTKMKRVEHKIPEIATA